jgi:hypothetical protein
MERVTDTAKGVEERLTGLLYRAAKREGVSLRSGH